MRIGILTFHAAHNYGAVLQCYALQEYLKTLGHEVAVIDYRNPQLLAVYDCFRRDRFVRRNPIQMARLFVKEVRYYKKRRLRYDAFESFINNRINTVPVETIYSRPFDWILIGSDQVWNFKLTRGFDSYYWGGFEHPESTQIASYAASMQDTWTEQEGETIKCLLENFDAISVREKSIADKLAKLSSSKPISHVVDPTLLFTIEQWDRVAEIPKVSEPYVLLYQVDPNPLAEQIATNIAEQRGLRKVCLSADVIGVNDKEVIGTSPEQFVGLFKYASFVVCASFHGTVFSLHFKRPFYSIRGKGKNARVESLLIQLNLSDRFIGEIPNKIENINYDIVDLGSLRTKSMNYLNSILIRNE